MGLIQYYVVDYGHNKHQFKGVYESLLRADAKFLPVVKRWLHKYGLSNIEPFEIISEVYIDGIEAIEKGQIIKNPKAWIRTVAFKKIANIMRNQYQDKKYFIELDAMENTDSIACEIASHNYDEDVEFDKKILLKKLLKARDELEPEDQMIFDLRFLQDLSWEHVREHMVISGIHISTATLRKRGERIKQRLKQFLLTKD